MSECCYLIASFKLNEYLSGIHRYTIPLFGQLNNEDNLDLNDTVSLFGNFLYNTTFNGSHIITVPLIGVYSCIPDAEELICFITLDFSNSCNSGHLVTAGF